jgi:hypothetical protein
MRTLNTPYPIFSDSLQIHEAEDLLLFDQVTCHKNGMLVYLVIVLK